MFHYFFRRLATPPTAEVDGAGQLAGGAMEKPDAEMLFKFDDTARDDGGGYALVAAGCRHAAQFIARTKTLMLRM